MNELLVYNRPKSHVSEAIRTLRTNLEFTFVGNEKNVILITSSMPGEGKSFVSANLAASFSMIYCKTILIDADMRKGRQHKIFNLDKDKGLSSLLLEDVKKYSKYICKTEIENLDVIPSGIVPPNPSELLGSEKTKELLELLKEKYDLIIIDCPPINAVTDALVLTKFADEVVLVSAYKITPIDLLEQSKKALENSGAKIAGVIVNKLENKKDHYYYGKYYN